VISFGAHLPLCILIGSPKNFPRIRQYPLYSKKEPPASLKEHFEPGVFEKSQNYGKDKAKFALFSGLYKQILDSVMLQYGFYAWSWNAGGWLIAKGGYGPEYEVNLESIRLTQQPSYLLLS
jgi:STE24 endopeptidase